MYKVGQKVKFQSRVRSGTGKLVDIRQGQKGAFYTVQPDDESKKVIVRESQLSPAK